MNEAERDEVLDDFALEVEKDSDALERYIARHPELALDLVDVARDVMRRPAPTPAPLSRREESLIDAGCRRVLQAAAPVTSPALRGRSVGDLRSIAAALGLPRQVLSALAGGRAIFTTIPECFLVRLAEAAGATLERVRAELDVPAPLALASSFKADRPLTAAEQVPFERLLIDAGLSPEDRARLLSDD